MKHIDTFLEKVFISYQKKWVSLKNNTFCIPAFVASMIIGFIAHGMAFFNKFCFGDDSIALFGIGATTTLGRWMLELLGQLDVKIIVGGHYSLPLVNGFISILFISLSSSLIVYLFSFRHKVSAICIGGLFVSYPVVTALFAYMFTAPYYMFGLFISVLGSVIVCKSHKLFSLIISIILITCSLGIYQAYFPVAISIMLIYYIKSTYENPSGWKHFVKDAFFYATCIILSFISYYFITRFSMHQSGVELSGYKGIDQMGKMSANEFVQRFIAAHSNFIRPLWTTRTYMYPMGLRRLYYWSLGLVLILSLLFFIRLLKAKISAGIQFLFLLLLIPLATNFIYIMCKPNEIHSLMMYGTFCYYILLIWMIDQTEFAYTHIAKAFYSVCFVLLVLGIFIYIRYSNVCYLKMDFLQTEAISYCTTLISGIKGTDGYRDEYPVVFLNIEDNSDFSVANVGSFGEVRIIPYYYDLPSITKGFCTVPIMKNWCGYSPAWGNPDDFVNLSEVEDMPCYPDDGSIRIINDTVVVKF